MKKLRRGLKVLILIIVAGLLSYALLRWRGLILFHDQVDPSGWTVFGVDVSSYQDEVDWPLLARQGVDFAFLKATEGSGLQDRCFADNWAGSADAGIMAGAYHFFSYDSSGDDQADNFIATVPVRAGALPPVIDIEFYGGYLEEPKAAEEVWPILDVLVARLEAHYGQKPILYVTERSYRLYVHGRYEGCPLWVSMPIVAPVWHDWTFWQYSHAARMEGYSGAEQRIDLNVFRGSAQALARLGR